MTRSTRWTLALLAVLAALLAGLVAELRSPDPQPTTGFAAGPAQQSVDAGALAELRGRAGLPPCPTGSGAGPAALRAVTVDCAANGRPVDVAGLVAGRRVVLNLWAYWCGPCRAELPALAEYQRRAGPGVTVLTVHQDDNEAAALALLADLGVRLPTLQDGHRRIAAALRLPNVMPQTVVLAADGSVARILPQAFATAEEIAAAVGGRGR